MNCENCKRLEATLAEVLGAFTRKLSIGEEGNVLEARMNTATIERMRAALQPPAREVEKPCEHRSINMLATWAECRVCGADLSDKPSEPRVEGEKRCPHGWDWRDGPECPECGAVKPAGEGRNSA